METKNKRGIALNLFILVLILAIIVFVSIKYAPEITRLLSTPEKFREFILSFGPLSVLIFMLFQVLQVVIAVIPGEIVQIMGGYIFGTFFGTVYSIIGIAAGSIIAFFIARLLGFNLVRKLVPEKDLKKFDFLINNPLSEIIIFFLFLIPGIPKDTLVYIAGLTPISPLKFLVVSALARLPAQIGSSYIGAHIQEKDYIPVIVVSVTACLLFVIGFLYKDRFIKLIHEKYSRRDVKPDGKSDQNLS